MIAEMLPLRLRDVVHVARARRASDIHLVPGTAPALRVDGRLSALDGIALEPAETEAYARELLGERCYEQFRRSRDASATWIDTSGASIRVHAFAGREGTCLALRLLERNVPDLPTLGMPEIVRAFAARERGLIVFAGPTGSGKSTSLAALVGEINRTRACRIITIEDPIEYRHANAAAVITQREIGRDVESFAHAIVGALRADPDVLMIGEMRDAATMRAALTAAETGHLVLTSLHTGSAAETIDRIVDAFDAGEHAFVRTQLAGVLEAVVAQRLVARIGGGRRPAAELLLGTDAVRSIVREGRTHQLRNAMTTGRAQGMQSIEQHLDELVARGEIAAEAAR